MTPFALTTARAELGLTVAEFARAVGVSRRAVYRWEDGERPIPAWVPIMVGLMTRRAGGRAAMTASSGSV